ncbi:MAG: carboxypeptidase-like regulatory domain-containing protein [Ignavibacteriaceae bacterium]
MKNKSFAITTFFLILIILIISDSNCMGQRTSNSESNGQEVLFSFSYPAVGNNTLINIVYSDGTVYLPLLKLFKLLYIPYEFDTTAYSVHGRFMNKTWKINISDYEAKVGKQVYKLNPNDYRLGPSDIFLLPRVFKKLFGLKFKVNFNALNVRLEPGQKLPVDEKIIRKNFIEQFENRKKEKQKAPLLFPFKRHLFGFGFLDYNVGISHSNGITESNYTFSGSAELLGGDIHGTIYGVKSKDYDKISYNNIYWRYVLPKSKVLSTIQIGQMITTGFYPQRVTGISLSNEPVIPRHIFNNFIFDGNTFPDADVELYVNDVLKGFAKADANGYYRFNIPLEYGTNNVSIKAYSPTGQINDNENKIRVPFTFLPKGVFAYNIQAGKPDQLYNYYGKSDVNFLLHGDVSYGLNRFVTLKADADWNNRDNLLVYGSVTARLLKEYMFNLNIAPGAFYGMNFNAVFPSGSNVSLNYAYYADSGAYNQMNMQNLLSANVYLPFKLFKLNSGLMIQAEGYTEGLILFSNYLFQYNTWIKRFGFRISEQGNLVYNNHKKELFSNFLNSSLTYNLPGGRNLFSILKNTNLRLQSKFYLHDLVPYSYGIYLNKSIWKNGMLTLNIEHNIPLGGNQLFVGIVFDFKKVRSSTEIATSPGSVFTHQSFSGGVGLDGPNQSLLYSNRDLSNNAAVAVLMFEDKNGDGIYDKGDVKIPGKFLRLDEQARFKIGRDSVLRITQLQPYWEYTADIIQSKIPDPTLAPLNYHFRFAADPGRFKQIEIPLYQTATLSGSVYIVKDSARIAAAGVNLILRNLKGNKTIKLRTFSDGSYYKTNLVPGHYRLEISPEQLKLMDAKSVPAKIEFIVKNLPHSTYTELNSLTIKALKNR